MPKGIVRVGVDLSQGHCYTPFLPVVGSPNVFGNKISIHREGDSWEVHTCGDQSHTGNLAKGSSTVFINLLGCAREGDSITCGDSSLMHSPNIFTGNG